VTCEVEQTGQHALMRRGCFLILHLKFVHNLFDVGNARGDLLNFGTGGFGIDSSG
jgi:hypothetical protein